MTSIVWVPLSQGWPVYQCPVPAFRPIPGPYLLRVHLVSERLRFKYKSAQLNSHVPFFYHINMNHPSPLQSSCICQQSLPETLPLRFPTTFKSISSLSDSVYHYRTLTGYYRGNARRNAGSEPVAVAVSMAILNLIMLYLPHDCRDNATKTLNERSSLARAYHTTCGYNCLS